MSVTIQKMTQQDFDSFYQWSQENYIEELVEQKKLPREDAAREAAQELSGMLPDGLYTENQQLMSIMADDRVAGYIWAFYEWTAGKKQCFLSDLAVRDVYRRRGYASQALRLMEERAVQDGCIESVLFVADSNCAARKLYEKVGYRVLRQSGYGKFMIKELRTGL